MSQYIPFVGFKWLTPDKIDGLDMNIIRKDNLEVCTLEVCFEYPEKLHDLLNHYPLVSEKLRTKKVC